MQSEADGCFTAQVVGAAAGTLYKFRVDGRGPFPASRAQPLGVHGTSEVVDATEFDGSDEAWGGTALEDVVVYELHVGTATVAGAATLLTVSLER